MNDIKERLDSVRELIRQEAFIEGKGLSNEVNIRIFCYNPEDEMIVKRFITQITTDPTMTCRIIECDLYKIFLEACEEIDILEAIPDMEETEGRAFLLEQLHATVGEDEFIDKMQYAPHQKGDVLLLTGIGEVFPFMRVHSLLEALQPHFSDVPILVMYPGEFTGYTLKLFNRLKPNDYYRAFNII